MFIVSLLFLIVLLYRLWYTSKQLMAQTGTPLYGVRVEDVIPIESILSERGIRATVVYTDRSAGYNPWTNTVYASVENTFYGILSRVHEMGHAVQYQRYPRWLKVTIAALRYPLLSWLCFSFALVSALVAHYAIFAIILLVAVDLIAYIDEMLATRCAAELLRDLKLEVLVSDLSWSLETYLLRLLIRLAVVLVIGSGVTLIFPI